MVRGNLWTTCPLLGRLCHWPFVSLVSYTLVECFSVTLATLVCVFAHVWQFLRIVDTFLCGPTSYLISTTPVLSQQHGLSYD